MPCQRFRVRTSVECLRELVPDLVGGLPDVEEQLSIQRLIKHSAVFEENYDSPNDVGVTLDFGPRDPPPRGRHAGDLALGHQNVPLSRMFVGGHAQTDASIRGAS